MSMNQHQHEYRVMTIIGNFHREAVQAEQRRLARASRPNSTFTRPLFGSARQIFGPEPTPVTELLTLPKDTAIIR